MGRRVEPDTSPADIDRETADRRFRQLSLRLRMCVPLEGDLWGRIDRGTKRAGEVTEPVARLEALLDLADDIRPLLPENVQRYTLPEFRAWRSEEAAGGN